MNTDLKVALIQTELAWEQPEANREVFQSQIDHISDPVDLIVLPEMFTTGFTMNAQEQAETMDGPSVQWMTTVAKEKQVAILGSLVIKEEDKFYNRLVFVYPNGDLKTYNKRHTFTLAGEDRVFSAGEERVIITYKGWKICPLICYDLRFPVWARYKEDYEVLIYVANWPKPRINAWDTLLQARAIENMSYCIGVNRIGTDEKGHEYVGHSVAYNALGESLTGFLPNENGIRIVTLNKENLMTTRDRFKFLDDKDAFSLSK